MDARAFGNERKYGEGRSTFPDLTVGENIELGGWFGKEL
jgi:hypothetical protein